MKKSISMCVVVAGAVLLSVSFGMTAYAVGQWCFFKVCIPAWPGEFTDKLIDKHDLDGDTVFDGIDQCLGERGSVAKNGCLYDPPEIVSGARYDASDRGIKFSVRGDEARVVLLKPDQSLFYAWSGVKAAGERWDYWTWRFGACGEYEIVVSATNGRRIPPQSRKKVLVDDGEICPQYQINSDLTINGGEDATVNEGESYTLRWSVSSVKGALKLSLQASDKLFQEFTVNEENANFGKNGAGAYAPRNPGEFTFKLLVKKVSDGSVVGQSREVRLRVVEKDTDGDGVPDKRDSCRTTKGSTINAGCVIPNDIAYGKKQTKWFGNNKEDCKNYTDCSGSCSDEALTSAYTCTEEDQLNDKPICTDYLSSGMFGYDYRSVNCKGNLYGLLDIFFICPSPPANEKKPCYSR